jgi:hypothetical protein
LPVEGSEFALQDLPGVGLGEQIGADVKGPWELASGYLGSAVSHEFVFGRPAQLAQVFGVPDDLLGERVHAAVVPPPLARTGES